jgi:cytochrome P450
MAEAPRSFFDPETLQDPYPFYAWLRREAPLWRVPETGHWVLSRYADLRRVCLEPETFSSRLAAVVTRDETGAVRLLDTGIASTPKGSVLGVADGAPHARHRQSVTRAFSARRMRQLEDVVRAIAAECVDACVRAREVDLVRDLARPVPARLMAAMLGLPRADDVRLQIWSDAAISLMGALPARDQIERSYQLVVELEAYLGERLDEALQAPGEDVIGDLARLALAGPADGLSRDEARGVLYQLVVGGSETTVGLLASAVRFAAELPGMWQRLRAGPDEIPAFVEESLRMETPALGNYRRTTCEVEIAGSRLPPGATLALLWASANRDEAEFADPDRFDLHRPNLKAHLGFGYGTHFCLGAAVARMETRIVLEELLVRASRVRIVAPEGGLRFVPTVFVRRLEALPAQLS